MVGLLDVQNLYSRNGQMWGINTEEGKKEEGRRKWWLDRIALCRNVEAWCQLSDYCRNTLCSKTLKWEWHGQYWVFTSETEVLQGRLFTFSFLLLFLQAPFCLLSLDLYSVLINQRTHCLSIFYFLFPKSSVHLIHAWHLYIVLCVNGTLTPRLHITCASLCKAFVFSTKNYIEW